MLPDYFILLPATIIAVAVVAFTFWLYGGEN